MPIVGNRFEVKRGPEHRYITINYTGYLSDAGALNLAIWLLLTVDASDDETEAAIKAALESL